MLHPHTTAPRIPSRHSRRYLDSFTDEIMESGLPLLNSLHLIYFPNSPKADAFRRDILTRYGIRDRFIGYRVALRERGVSHDLIRLLNL